VRLYGVYRLRDKTNSVEEDSIADGRYCDHRQERREVVAEKFRGAVQLYTAGHHGRHAAAVQESLERRSYTDEPYCHGIHALYSL